MLPAMWLRSNMPPVVVRPHSPLLTIRLTRIFRNYQGHCERPYTPLNTLAYPCISPLCLWTPCLSKSRSVDRHSIHYVGKQPPYPWWCSRSQLGHAFSPRGPFAAFEMPSEYWHYCRSLTPALLTIFTHEKPLSQGRFPSRVCEQRLLPPHWYLPVQHKRHRYDFFVSFVSNFLSRYSVRVSQSSFPRLGPLNYLERDVWLEHVRQEYRSTTVVFTFLNNTQWLSLYPTNFPDWELLQNIFWWYSELSMG